MFDGDQPLQVAAGEPRRAQQREFAPPLENVASDHRNQSETTQHETESTQRLDRSDDPTPLTTLRDHLLGVLAGLERDAQLRRVFEIATHKIEYVDELTAVRERHLQIRNDYTEVLERTLRAAQRRGHVRRSPSARHMAIGLHALLNGLIQNWMLDPAGFALMPVGRLAIESFLAGLAQPQRPAD